MRILSKFVIGILLLLHIPILFAGLFAPYPYDEQHRDFSYERPSLAVHGPAGCDVYWFRGGRLFSTPPPCGLFLAGTDAFGRDILSRVLYGGRISILAGWMATLLALGIGTAAGTAAGFYGGWVERISMRGGELFLALPWLYLLLAVRATLSLHISTVQAFLLVTVLVGTMGWVRPARLIRGVVLTTRERGYVLAARGFGASDWYLIRRHILPAIQGVVVTQAVILIPQFILAEVTLSFLGLGISEPVPSWGNLLVEARQYFSLVAHPWLLAPGFAMVPLLLAYLVLADSTFMASGKIPYEPSGKRVLDQGRYPSG